MRAFSSAQSLGRRGADFAIANAAAATFSRMAWNGIGLPFFALRSFWYVPVLKGQFYSLGQNEHEGRR